MANSNKHLLCAIHSAKHFYVFISPCHPNKLYEVNDMMTATTTTTSMTITIIISHLLTNKGLVTLLKVIQVLTARGRIYLTICLSLWKKGFYFRIIE